MRTEPLTADYLAEQAKELAVLATGAGFTALAYIFNIAELEALSVAAANERPLVPELSRDERFLARLRSQSIIGFDSPSNPG